MDASSRFGQSLEVTGHRFEVLSKLIGDRLQEGTPGSRDLPHHDRRLVAEEERRLAAVG